MSLPATAPQDKSPESTRQSSRAATILVVDDSESDVELLQHMLRRYAVLNPVQAVQSVHDAICYLKGEGIYQDRQRYPFPILVLLDLHLPDGTAFNVLHWLEAHPTRLPTAVVVLTGSDRNAIQRSYAMGAHSFLVKPLRFEDLQNMVSNVRGLKLTRTAEGHILQADP